MYRNIVLLVVILVGFGIIACGNSDSPGENSPQSIEEIKGPPEGGKVIGPLTIKFMGFEARSGGSKKAAKFIIYNSSDESIQRLSLTLRYLDETGGELSTFPWSLSGFPAFLSPKEKKVEIMGMGVPENCVSVDMELRFFE
jgi:hypothetical protein